MRFSQASSGIQFMGSSRQMVSPKMQPAINYSGTDEVDCQLYESVVSRFSLLTFALSTVSLQMSLAPRTEKTSDWRENESQTGGCSAPHPPPSSSLIRSWLRMYLGQRSICGPQPKSGPWPAFCRQRALRAQPPPFA